MMQETEKNKAIEYFRRHKADFIETLKDLARIPSVSFPGFPAQELDRSAEFVREQMVEAGLEKIEIVRIPGAHPYVYGELVRNTAAPTILLYAHHDVQPPLREENWQSPPFEPAERDGRIYARGIADDKAGVMLHLASIASYVKSGAALPVNVKVLIEGEEETGSGHLPEFLSRYSEKFMSDCIVLADGSNYDTGIPSLTVSLRGLAALDVTVSVMESPLHSGIWGGPIPDPVVGLSKILGSLLDEKGRISLPELWEDVLPPAPDEMNDLRQLHMTSDLFREQSKVHPETALFGKDEELLLKLWNEPSLTVNSIEAGGGRNAGNVVMNEAWARIGIRLVPEMDPEKTLHILKEYLKAKCPWGMRISFTEQAGVGPWKTSTKNRIFQIAKKSLSVAYGKDTVFIGCGGTIPFAEPMSRALGNVPALLLGVEDPYTNAHSENESLCISDFQKAVEGQIGFFSNLAQEW